MDEFSCRKVPDFYRFIVRTRENITTIRREITAANLLRMCF